MARILIVEDERTDQLLLCSIFERTEHEVYLAKDGEQAFRTYLSRDIEVVVTDLHMPNVDGLELIEALLAMYPEAPIIAVSGKGPTLLAQAANLGAVAVFSKPVAPDELLRAVEKALSGR